MSTSAVILLHYPERDARNGRKIVDALKESSVKLDRIIVFIDNPQVKFSDPEVTTIRSNRPFPVIARNAIGTLCDSDHIFFQDSDLSVEKDTIKTFQEYADKYPLGVLGFEGSDMAETMFPYTDGKSYGRGDKLIEADMLIRTWYIPRRVVGMAINLYLNNAGKIPDRYVDDILFCLGNRYGLREKNYVIPCLPGAGCVELGEGTEAQSFSTQHYQIRNQVCRYLMGARE